MPNTLRRRTFLWVWALPALLSGCASLLYPVPDPPSAADSAAASKTLVSVVRRYWVDVLPTRPDLASRLDLRVDPTPRPVMSRSTRNTARQLSDLLDRVDPEALSARSYATYQTLRWQLETMTEASVYAPIDFSIMTVRSSGLGHLLGGLRETSVRDAGDLQRLLYHMDALSWWFSDVSAVLQSSAMQGVRGNKDATRAFRMELLGLRNALQAAPVLDSSRVRGLDSTVVGIFRAEEERAMKERILPALDSLTNLLADYEKDAMPRPGLWQYPGGKEYYRHLLRRGLGVEITPEEAHRVALTELQRADSLRRIVLNRMGWRRSIPEFHDSLRKRTAIDTDLEGVAAKGLLLMAAMKDSLTSRVTGPLPSLPDVVIARGLDLLLHPAGGIRAPEYRDSGAVLLMTPAWLRADIRAEGRSLYYRWGWPGASLATSVAFSRDSLDPIVLLHPAEATQRGWMEYGASLAGELGFYGDPFDAYGRLLHEGWNAALLACDTGVHYLGWSRAQALSVLRSWSVADSAELDSLFVETVVRVPGTAGGAVLGSREFAAMRQWARSKLGSEFDEAKWHRDILSLGPTPLPVMASYLEWWMYEEHRLHEVARKAASKARR